MSDLKAMVREAVDAANVSSASAHRSELAVIEVKGMFVQMSAALNEHIRECRRAKLNGGLPPATDSKPGRRTHDDSEDYDPEITATGRHVRVDRVGFERDRNELAELRQLRADVDLILTQKRDAELRALGAEDERKRAEERATKAEDDQTKSSKGFDRRLRRAVVIAGLVATSLSIAAHFMKLLPNVEHVAK